MKPRRVRHYSEPGYPTQAFLARHPELLRHVPVRWRGNPLVLGALSLVIPLALACQAGCRAEKAVRIAPLFIHGEGRGAFGCQIVNPPVFLSEEEARQVIQDEAKKAGIEFVPDSRVLDGAKIPVTNPFEGLEERTTGKRNTPKARKGSLALDGYDAKRGIGYEVVSGTDFEAWEKQDGEMWSSISAFDYRETAQRLREGLARARGAVTVATFYTPVNLLPEPTAAEQEQLRERQEALMEEMEEIARAGKAMSNEELIFRANAIREDLSPATKKAGEEQLRAQVHDFLQWLKAQGVI